MKLKIRQKAYQIGFDICGFTNDFEPTHADYFQQWLADKKFSGMTWLDRNTDKRLRPDTLLPDAKTAIVVAVSYKHDPEENEYKVARYAHGDDYHDWMRLKLNELAHCISDEIIPGAVCRAFVDTGPVLERDLAAKAGIGWVGKNTCLINRDVGSYVFLGTIFCDREFPGDAPKIDQCLDCRLCLDACPTNALTPYQLDPGKCIAYHNIEKRGERDSAYWSALGEHLVGCDVCQEVCPWNFSAPETNQESWLKSFQPREMGELQNILQMSALDYKAKIKGSAISRIKYDDFMRNVFLVIANTKRKDLKDHVLRWRERNPDLQLLEYQYCLKAIL